jgi:hypothetical protein
MRTDEIGHHCGAWLDDGSRCGDRDVVMDGRIGWRCSKHMRATLPPALVIDELGMVHSRANWEAMQKTLPPLWLKVLGHAEPFDPGTVFRIPVISDPSMPPNTLELRSGDQRIRVRWPDEATELDRWADDGGAL